VRCEEQLAPIVVISAATVVLSDSTRKMVPV
jgi:hypothetical protein